MSEKEPMFADNDDWTMDADGVEYDASLLRRENSFLETYHKGDRGFITIPSAQSSKLTLTSDGCSLTPEQSEPEQEGYRHVFRVSGGGRTMIVAAIPGALVDRPEYAHDVHDGTELAVQRDLLEAWSSIDDARLKMKRAYPDQMAALSTVHHDLTFVMRSIQARWDPSSQPMRVEDFFADDARAPKRTNERILELIEGPILHPGLEMGLERRLDAIEERRNSTS